MAYASVAELASWMGRDAFEPPFDQRAEILLDVASATIDNEIRQSLELREHTLILDGPGTRTLIVPRWPIVEIISLIEGGEALTEDEDFVWSSGGLITRLGTVWICKPRNITTILRAGHDPVPDDMKGLSLRLASRAWDNPIGAQSEQLGDRMVQWRVSGMDLTAGEARLVERYRSHQ